MLRTVLRICFLMVALGVVLLVLAPPIIVSTVRAEPYMAVRTGLSCLECHADPTGGGMRREEGLFYAAMDLPMPSKPSAVSNGDGDNDSGPPALPEWSGRIEKHIAIGGDMRVRLRSLGDFDSAGGVDFVVDEFNFKLTEGQLYLLADIIPNRVQFYVDEPVGFSPRTPQSFLLLWDRERTAYLKAGRFILPYGLRIYDDEAFIRQATEVNFAHSEAGVEAGGLFGPAEINVAVTNGTFGEDNDLGKRYSLRAALVRDRWRLGASYNFNDQGADERRMGGIFGGWQTGAVTWLGEADLISQDGTPSGRLDQVAGLVESALLVKQGITLRLRYEYWDPDLDADNDEHQRVSVLGEIFPTFATHLRFGYRFYKTVTTNIGEESDELFISLHVFF